MRAWRDKIQTAQRIVRQQQRCAQGDPRAESAARPVVGERGRGSIKAETTAPATVHEQACLFAGLEHVLVRLELLLLALAHGQRRLALSKLEALLQALLPDAREEPVVYVSLPEI